MGFLSAGRQQREAMFACVLIALVACTHADSPSQLDSPNMRKGLTKLAKYAGDSSMGSSLAQKNMMRHRRVLGTEKQDVKGHNKDGLGGKEHLHSYHTSAEIFEQITALSKDCAVDLKVSEVKDQEDPSNSLFVAHLGDATAEKKVLVAANEHARELLTGEVALRFIQKACGKEKRTSPTSLAQTKPSSLVTSDATTLLQNVQYTILPVVNVKGRALVETGEKPCQRMTTDEEGQVDLNRNMDVDWGKGDPQSWGPKPFSTFEARVLRDIAADLKL